MVSVMAEKSVLLEVFEFEVGILIRLIVYGRRKKCPNHFRK